MIGGVGHMQDVVNKIKQNKGQKASQRKTRKKYTSTKNTFTVTEYNYTSISQEELTELNRKYREEAKKERRRLNVIRLLAAFILFLWVYIFF